MNLSPFTNYTIRRMLQEHVDSLSEIQARSLYVSDTFSINKLLSTLYPKKFVAITKVHHLEMLTALYHQATAQRIANIKTQNELRRRIFEVLGIRFGVTEVACPSIIPENTGTTFNFFAGGEVREGIRLGHKLYGKVDFVTMHQRPQIYQLALAFSEKNISCVITTSEESYALWVLLRSPAYNVFLRQGIVSVKKALVLHSALCRFKQAKFAVQY